jgi:hypothetical protein
MARENARFGSGRNQCRAAGGHTDRRQPFKYTHDIVVGDGRSGEVDAKRAVKLQIEETRSEQLALTVDAVSVSAGTRAGAELDLNDATSVVGHYVAQLRAVGQAKQRVEPAGHPID